MIAQDTGSAIVGPARADLYFGAGLEAGRVAGRLKNNARFVMLLPKSLDPSARGRKLPLPDARPSEKIAKLFPQTAPAAKPATPVVAGNSPTTQGTAAAPAAIVKPVPLPAARPKIAASRDTRRTRNNRIR
jgi:membrane-bound lytic murein transglycosylase A